ncbi:hypothetical protein HXZ88_04135 [Myroides odoratimimus]|uniref:hypothetical protein n=1 Tax=Myroides TaxID=76831 RepID=UPI00131AE972|nr:MULTISPECIES: hypothetical protein [Myroides]MDM1064808.1 hypothetical protein [Myroides odoratimimus]MDM1400887.1 hypothetical protein [Myroides odoratimimus]MDM1443288.1 hypothetical protein [Myroides odoratimimus]
MTIFLITTATILFTCLLLNFGQYYFKKIYPYLLGQTVIWDKQNDRLKLILGLTTLFFAYFSFQSIWVAGTVFEELNLVLYAILLVSNILFYVIYIQNKILFNTPSLTTDSDEKKKIEEQIKEQIAQEQEDIRFEQKVKEYQKKIKATIDFIKGEGNKSINLYSNLTSHKTQENNFTSNSFTFKNIDDEKSKKIAEEYLPYFNNDISTLSLFVSNPLGADLALNCIYTSRNRQVSYIKIFELLNTICAEDILDLFEEERSKMCHFIVRKFKRNGKSIDQNNLKTAFSKWRTKNG